MKKTLFLLTICLVFSCSKNDIPIEEIDSIVDLKLVGKWSISWYASGFSRATVHQKGDVVWEFTDKGEMIINNTVNDIYTSSSGTYLYYINKSKDTFKRADVRSFAKYYFKQNDSILIIDYGIDHDAVIYNLIKYE